MTYFSTKVLDLNDVAAELNRLVAAGHTIFQLLSYDGKVVIISTHA
jgi:hypothetical protein